MDTFNYSFRCRFVYACSNRLTNCFRIANSLKNGLLLKNKRRIDKNKDLVDLWIKTVNAKYGELNEIINIDTKTPYC